MHETLAALQRAQARMRSDSLPADSRPSPAALLPDADLFMIKNLLVLKDELLALDGKAGKLSRFERPHRGYAQYAVFRRGLTHGPSAR